MRGGLCGAKGRFKAIISLSISRVHVEIREKIAYARFVTALSDKFIKRTLQLDVSSQCVFAESRLREQRQ